jgi:hypothetical protein
MEEVRVNKFEVQHMCVRRVGSTMEFYAAMKKNEMLSFAGKCIELENIILSDVSLAQKTKNRMFSFICRH